jgi:hypothetical protein
MTATEFKKLNIAQKYRLLREESVFVASRIHGGYRVGLYRLDDLYIEAFFRLGLTQMDMAEPATEERVREYLDNAKGMDWWEQ